VTGRVIDGLQPVEVDHQYAEAAAAASGALYLLLEGREERGAVEEAGERVGLRQLQDLGAHAALGARVDAGEIGEQVEGAQVDRHPQQVDAGCAEARVQQQLADVGQRGGGRHEERQPTPHRQRRGDDEQVVGEDERRAGATSEPDEARCQGQGRNYLEADREAPPQSARQHLVQDHDDHDRRPAESVDAGAVVRKRPRYAHADEHERDRHPPHHPDHRFVRRRQRGVGGPIDCRCGGD
jgi:hypothetical protein